MTDVLLQKEPDFEADAVYLIYIKDVSCASGVADRHIRCSSYATRNRILLKSAPRTISTTMTLVLYMAFLAECQIRSHGHDVPWPAIRS